MADINIDVNPQSSTIIIEQDIPQQIIDLTN